jgi:hypothetical protein
MMVPVEYIGRARALRTALVAQHAAAVAEADRLSVPLRARFALGQTPSPGAFAKVAAAWRDRIPSAGRLGLTINHARTRLTIAETRAAPTEFRFDTWGDGDHETAIVITQTTLAVSARRFEFDEVPAAAVPLHALARRFQRGWHVSDAAICADLSALAVPCVDTLDRGGDFDVPLRDGRWVGTVTEIDYRGEPVRILVVRSFKSDDMTVRTGTLVEAAAYL